MTDKTREALASLVAALDKRHHGRMPEEVQRAMDSARAALAAEPAQEAQPVVSIHNCAHRWELTQVGPTTEQHSWWCRQCGATTTTWPDKPGYRALAPGPDAQIKFFYLPASPQPPQPESEALTDEQIEQLWRAHCQYWELVEPYEMDDPDRALIIKVREAIEYENNGDPAKDVIDEDEMIDAMRLLLEIIDAGCAS